MRVNHGFISKIKTPHPVELVEYAKARGIPDEPVFIRWVPYTLGKGDIIIFAVK